MSKTLDRCCRLEFLLSPDRIDTIRKVYGDIDYYDNTGPDEPKHGWLMKEPTMPCDHLTPDGCQFELQGLKKPERCRSFPSSKKDLHLIKTCGFRFQGAKRVGKCNRCE